MTIHYPPITVAVPGTCGELVQGWSPEWDEPVLVSCPIARYSRVQVQIEPVPGIRLPGRRQTLPKLVRAARLFLEYAGRPDLGATAAVQSDLLPGRGMASSTADIVGVMAALALGLDFPLAPEEMARLACRIEPSDSTMFPDLTLLAYRGSARCQRLGPCPPLALLLLDAGPPVDTLRFNARLNLDAVRKLAPATAEAVALLTAGLRTGNPAEIAAAASLSAASYQVVSPHPLLEQAVRWAGETGALGVVRAHSGSVIGLLFPAAASLQEPARWLARRFRGRIVQTALVPGGAQVLTPGIPFPLMEVNQTL
ncbi:MAG: hypothetical protein D6784_03410 [Chloroflexi bacterium]|nr:MAG: hypothetical protein D6784_03410 [Chloroflexota bacterium]